MNYQTNADYIAGINTPLDYLAETYGDAVNYWTRTTDRPAQLPAPERAAWHRKAEDYEQNELWTMIEKAMVAR